MLVPSGTSDNIFEIRAMGKAGNIGEWATGQGFKVADYPQDGGSVSYAGSKWSSQSSPDFFGGSSKYASAAGAKATFTFSGSKQVGWATSKNNNRGMVKVNLYNGATLVSSETVDLYLASFQLRQLLFAKGGLDPAKSYKVVVEVLGQKSASSTGTRVDVDSFEVIK